MNNRTIILDTDIGYDPDDLFALLLLMNHAKNSVRLIVTANECGGKRLRFLNKTLTIMGIDGVKTCAGKDLGHDKFTVDSLLEGSTHTEAPGDYVEAMLSVINDSTNPVLYIGLGGFTNLAGFLKKYPDEAKNMTYVLMGGALDYERLPGWIEYNIKIDPDSAAAVLAADLDVTMIMAQTTHDPVYEVTWDSDLYKKLKVSDKPTHRLLAEHCDLWFARREYRHGTSMHDPLTVSVALGYDFVTLDRATISLQAGKFVHDTQGHPIRYSLPSSQSKNFMDFMENELLAQ